MHKAANHEARHCTTAQVQRRSFFHVQIFGESSLGQEVSGELHRATKTGSDHSGAHSTVNTPNALTRVNLAQSIERVLIVMLGANGKERRVGLKASFHQKEWRSGSGTKNTGESAREDIDTEGLNLGIVEDGRGSIGSDGLVETKTATVKQHLVDVLWNESLLLALSHCRRKAAGKPIDMTHTADPIPRNRPFGPSFCKITLTPCRTPLYFFAASPFACNSPWSCNRIFTVSKLWVTVTAPQAAMPPAMNDLLIAPTHQFLPWK